MHIFCIRVLVKCCILTSVFAGLFLIVASSQVAYAQSLVLESGDKITVDSNGTHGTIAGSSYSKPATNSYSSSDVDTEAITVSSGHYYTDVVIPASEFTLGQGGTINAISDGTGLKNKGVIILNGGTVNANGGYGIVNTFEGTVTINGGSIQASKGGTGLDNSNYVMSNKLGVVNITGGSIIVSDDYSTGLNNTHTVNISGGTTIARGKRSVIFLNDFGGSTGVINLFSKNDTPFYFSNENNLIPVPMNNTSFDYSEDFFKVTGTLRDGTPFNATFTNYGTINLNPDVKSNDEQSLPTGVIKSKWHQQLRLRKH